MARLTAGVRARALLRQVTASGGFGAVVRHGDETAGDLVLLVRGGALVPDAPDTGRAPTAAEVLRPVITADGDAAWMRLGRPGFATVTEAEETVARAVARDPDLWVLDLEPGPGGLSLDAPLVAAPADPTPDPTRAAAEALFRPRRPRR